MPPYSWGRCGAHRPALRTRFLMSSRSSRASFFSTSLMLSPPRRKFHSLVSLGRMSSLMISAVRMRMSLMRSSSVGMGLTFIGMVATSVLGWRRRYSPRLRLIAGADVDAVGGVEEVGAGVAVAHELGD